MKPQIGMEGLFAEDTLLVGVACDFNKKRVSLRMYSWGGVPQHVLFTGVEYLSTALQTAWKTQGWIESGGAVLELGDTLHKLQIYSYDTGELLLTVQFAGYEVKRSRRDFWGRPVDWRSDNFFGEE